ncbi:MAG: extracellular solute-binding protein [Planctomycetota bacterium]
MRTAAPIAALAAAAAWSLAGCDAPPSEEVVLYVSADEYVARQVVRVFERETGIRVLFTGDSEARKTTGLVERLRAERDRPRADVFWSSEIFQTIALADEGVLAPHDSPAGRARPARYRDADGRWYGFAARARVLVFAPDRVPPGERPSTWSDLADPRWEGRLAMADPRFGTTGGHLGAMKRWWAARDDGGDDRYARLLRGLADNGVTVTPAGNAGVVDLVARGEADLGLTDTDDVRAARANGLAVDMLLPRHADDDRPGGGTLLIPNTAGLVAGGPHPGAAARLLEFLLSPRVERMLAESVSGNVPLRPEVAGDYPGLAVPDPLDVDFAAAAAARAEAVREASTLLLARGAREGR